MLIKSISATESFDCLPEHGDALVQFIYGNKLAGAMRNADVARAKYYCFSAQGYHAGGLGPERHRSGCLSGSLFKKLHEF
jgi:hypothetical protein